MKRLVLIFSLVLLLCGCKNTKIDTHNMFYMDTYIEVKLYDVKDSEKIFAEVEKIFSEYHKLVDRYNEYDGLVNIYYLNNKLKVGTEIILDDRLADIIRYGINAYNDTEWYVNITLGNNLFKESDKNRG